MTTPPVPGAADAPRPRPSIAILVVLYALMFVVAAATPLTEFVLNQGDVGLYLQNARHVLAGEVPYRDFFLEYPPLALVPMVAPVLLWPFGRVDFELYRWLFAGWSAALLVGLGYVLFQVVRLGGDVAPATLARQPVATIAEPKRERDRQNDTGLRLIMLSFGAALVLAWRFDLFPALLLMAAIWAALDGRATTSGVVLGLAILAKAYPVVAIPVIAAAWLAQRDVDRTVRFVGGVVGTVAAGMLPFLAIAGDEAVRFLSYQAARGLQLESVGGGLVLLDGLVRGAPAQVYYEFSSVQVGGPLAETWLGALPILTLAAFGTLGVLGWRRLREDVALHGTVLSGTVVLLAGAAVLIGIATNKVFSIQYVVWLLPFAALLSWRLFAIAILVFGLTMPIHPLLYGQLEHQEALPVVLLNLRNGLLLLLLAGVLLALRTSPARVARAAALPSGGAAA